MCFPVSSLFFTLHQMPLPLTSVFLCFRPGMAGKKPPEGEKAPGAGGSGGDKDKKAGKLPKFKFAQREVFDQSKYLEKEVKIISYEKLRRDDTPQYGQIRPLPESHRQKLVAEFKANPQGRSTSLYGCILVCFLPSPTLLAPRTPSGSRLLGLAVTRVVTLPIR